MRFFGFSLLSLLVSATPAFAAKHGDFTAGVGLINHNVLSVAKGATAATSPEGTFQFPGTIRYYLGISENWLWSPYLSTTHLTSLLLPSETPEGGAKKDILLLGILPFTSVSDAPGFDYSLGLGLFIYHIQGKGGTTEQNNGRGTTIFGQPSKDVMTKNWYVDLGGGMNWDAYRLDVNLILLSVFSERRAYSILTSFTWKLNSGF